LWAAEELYSARRGESLPPQAIRFIPRTQPESAANDSSGPFHFRETRPTFLLAWRLGRCQTCHLDQLASSGIPALLALEIAAIGKAQAAG
jgi:hypothetical protein